ncbi:restriction endonuclease [Streptomyces sp. NBC_01433]|uniref:restriction endonuclease n=1 Tax=Streptomyces sp. NBC_01433 TaxID=2903864 RepID=UPI002259784D|nr:restriction endonuclease [Streptomyces sp. NBC_01433]MCX4676190.1 restriction endonuclease [Streptomyces sp. NBC_01433]
MGSVMYLRSAPGADGHTDWRGFEEVVTRRVADLDSAATVTHNARLKGRLSGIERQIDVLVTGKLAGTQIKIVFECKRYERSVGLVTVEEFIGKLHDLEADRGALCVFGGITAPALSRLAHAAHPQIDLYLWERPRPRWEDLEEDFEEAILSRAPATRRLLYVNPKAGL